MVQKPLPCHVLLYQGEKWLNDVGNFGNKLAIEVAEAHE